MFKYVPENFLKNLGENEINEEEINKKLDELISQGFLDEKDRDNKSKQVKALKEQFLSIENVSDAQNLFNYNPILDENFSYYNVNLNDVYYRPQTIFNMFVAANINLSDYRAVIDNACKAFNDQQLQNKRESAKYFSEFVANGGNIETLKTILLKQQRLFLKENRESKDPDYEDAELAVMNLKDRLNSVKTPYDRVFEISGKITETKRQLNKMYNTQDYSMQAKLEAELEALETQFGDEAKKFDPEMLADVARSRQERIVEEEKLKAEVKGLENQPVVMTNDEYFDAKRVEAYAEKQIKQNTQTQNREI